MRDGTCGFHFGSFGPTMEASYPEGTRGPKELGLLIGYDRKIGRDTL